MARVSVQSPLQTGEHATHHRRTHTHTHLLSNPQHADDTACSHIGILIGHTRELCPSLYTWVCKRGGMGEHQYDIVCCVRPSISNGGTEQNVRDHSNQDKSIIEGSVGSGATKQAREVKRLTHNVWRTVCEHGINLVTYMYWTELLLTEISDEQLAVLHCLAPTTCSETEQPIYHYPENSNWGQAGRRQRSAQQQTPLPLTVADCVPCKRENILVWVRSTGCSLPWLGEGRSPWGTDTSMAGRSGTICNSSTVYRTRIRKEAM